jgi:hypothetical protein
MNRQSRIAGLSRLLIGIFAVATAGNAIAATVVFDEGFLGTGTVPSGWITEGAGVGSASLGYANGYFSMSTCALVPGCGPPGPSAPSVLRNTAATFDPTVAGTTVTITSSIVSFTGSTNVMGVGTSGNDIGFGISSTGNLRVSTSFGSTSRQTGLNTTIPGYGGGPIDVTLEVNASGYRVTTNTGYDSGVQAHSWSNGWTWSGLSTSSTGAFGLIFESESGQWDRVRLFTAVGADAAVVSTATVQSTTTATTSLSVTSGGSVDQTGGTTTVLQTMTVDAGGNYTLSGGTLDASTIDANGTFDFTGGTLSVDEFQGDLTNQGGTLSPGNSPGLTEITGDYDQQSAGTLDIELAGLIAVSEYDQVQVSGTATLGGTLDVDLLYGFTPALGNSFDILLAEVVSGTFGTTLFPSLPAGLTWNLQYLTDAIGSTDVVRLSVQQVVPIPAAVWLFGGALGALGWLRRRAKTA